MFRIKNLLNFLKVESLGGFLLIFSSFAALLISNSGGKEIYYTVKNFEISFLLLHKPLHLLVNDGLMAMFLFLIGLELKREFTTGHLSGENAYKVPLMGALGGFIVPICIFCLFTYKTIFINGWAIPSATDIAFTLAIISLIPKIPKKLKALIVAITIFDDIAAILVISIFFTKVLNYNYLSMSIFAHVIGFYILKNKFNYLILSLLGFILWLLIFKSGVHATIAGVLLSSIVPDKNLVEIENKIHAFVAYLVLPLFAFVNAGVTLDANILQTITNPLVMGISLGLFIGKPIGVTTFILIGVKLGLYKLKSISLLDILFVSILTGIGFTMSFFIGNLAFSKLYILNYVKIGVLLGSCPAALVGYILCKRHFNKNT